MSESMISHYRIIEKLGEGGMGVVYRAQDTRLNRSVALKLLPASLVEDAERRRRFQQEAQAASALNHPNIVTIYDIGEADGTMFIAMENVAGKTMAELIPRDGMRPPEALKYAVQIADAFARAHTAGIVHRDLKPGNLMVTDDGLVKVLDFGLAKLTEAREPRDQSTVSMTPQTLAGTVLGTPAFMSPEQAAGETVDARSDIFSFGAVLYEMVTGRRAFRGDTQVATIAAVLGQEPEPPPEKVSTELAKIILRCLRKDRARRYQSMADLKVALDDVREELASGDRKARAPSPRRWLPVALPAIVLVAGFLAWRVWRGGPETTEPLRAVSLTTLAGVERYPSFSPDGNLVAFTWTGTKQDNPDVYVQQIGSGSPLRLTTDSSNDYNPAWSPDGRWIAFLRSRAQAGQSELRLIPPLGGPERKLAEIHVRGGTFVTPPYLSWCPESDCLVVTDSPGEGQPDALFVISAETGERRQLTEPQPPASGDTNPVVSPDGSWLVFRRMATLFTGELHRLPLGRGLTAAGEPRSMTPAALDASYPTWMPDSREILFAAKGHLWRLIVPGENTPARLPFVGEDGLMPVVSRPQPGRAPRLVYIRHFDDFNIWRVETSAPGAPPSAPPAVAISSTRNDSMPNLSPDGRRVAFTSDRSGEWNIWLSDPDGSNAVQLTSMGGATTGWPQWSPDGEWISFHSNPEGQWEVYVIPAAGGKPRNLTSHPAADSAASFSRDGQWVYFNSTRTGAHQIWKMPASGGDAVQLTSNGGFWALESPDGAYLYYVQTVDAPSPVWRLPVSGGAPVKVLEGVVLANFAVLAGGIYYIDRVSGPEGTHYLDSPSGETRLQYFDFATGTARTVAGNLGDTVDLPLTASRDGRTILYARMDSSVDDLMLVEDLR